MTSSATGSRLGQALREARTDAGATLEQVSARTRIRVPVLRDLEAGVLSSSGGTVYARGHVRSVAQALGVDPAPLLAAFDAEAGRAPAPVAETVHPQPARAGSLGVPAAARPERRGPHWGGALVAALSVLVLLLAVGTVNDPEVRVPAEADDLFAAPVAPAAPPAARPTATARPLTASVPQGARLRLRVLGGSSWIRVQASGKTVFEGVVGAGQPPRDFVDAQQLHLLVGNAAALAVVCGSKELAPAGPPGAVGTVNDPEVRVPAEADDLFAAPVAPVAPPAARPTATARPLTASVPQKGARLRLRVVGGSSWIRVQASGKTVFEGVVGAGQPPRDFVDAQQLHLLVGNAAALAVVCGSKELAPAGPPGAVRRFTCSPSGLAPA